MKHTHPCSRIPAHAQEYNVQKQSVGPFTLFHATGGVDGTFQFNSFGVFKNR